MSSEEKKQILKMVEAGKISADEAVSLIKALEESQAEDEIEVIGTGAGHERFSDAQADPARSKMAEFESIKARARRFAAIPLGIGSLITVLAAYWMFTLVQDLEFRTGYRIKQAVATRDEIIEAIRVTAKRNGGTPLGKIRLFKETGIAEHHYLKYGKLGQLQQEAGFDANELNKAASEDDLIGINYPSSLKKILSLLNCKHNRINISEKKKS